MSISPLWNPTGYLIELAVRKTMERFSNSAENSDVSADDLSQDAVKVNIQSAVLQEQAKVEQELSIARRILIAEEVEIEEYYDTSGKGGLGFKSDAEEVSLGASGSGRKVTKRIVKFKGFNSQAQEMLAQSDAKNASQNSEAEILRNDDSLKV